jgi:hypothetical protein
MMIPNLDTVFRHVTVLCAAVLSKTVHLFPICILYLSVYIIKVIKSKRMRWERHASRMGEKRNAYRILVGKPEEKGPLGRPKRRWENNIRMDLRDRMGWYGLD